MIKIRNHNCQYNLRLILRELVILRKLTQDENNIFTCKLKTIILPENVIINNNPTTNSKGLESDDVKFDLSALKHIFIVMDLE